MKNVSKNKFWVCFRPVDVDLVGVPLDSKPKKKALIYGVETQANMNSPVPKLPHHPIVPPQPRQRKTFSQVVKAVLFETVLAKRVHDKRYKSKQNISSDKAGEVLGSSNRMPVQTGHNHILENNPTSSSQRSLSCSCSRDQGNLVPEIGKNNIVNQDRTGIRGPNLNYVIYLLLLSLAVTVLGGKVCSILCTSICLYCFPKIRAGSQGDRLENVRRLPPGRAKKEEYRKVIIEGLLPRNCHKEGQ